MDLGIPEDEANFYAEGLRRGGALVTAHVPEMHEAEARRIIQRHNPVDFQSRREQWRAAGWNAFNPAGEAYTTDQLERERAEYRSYVGDAGRALSEVESGAYQQNYMEGDPRDVEAAQAAGQQVNKMEDSERYNKFYDYDKDFREHFNKNFAQSGYPYERFAPAYQYGYMVASDERYDEYTWDQLEPAMRRRWEEARRDPWDEVKEAAREAWQRVKNALT